jgi:colanic acid/amylovoran biosynthesis glycosyltransferase
VGEDGQVVRLAYLCSQYPAISHTFVLREVEALRRRGLQIDTFSIHRASAEHLLADADRAAFESTFAILPTTPRRLLGAHLRLLVGAPTAYLRVLALALRLSSPGLRGRLWQIFYFAEAVILWNECAQRDIRHIHVHLANVAADVALLASEIGSAIDAARRWSWSFTMHGPTELFDVRWFRLAEKLRRARFVVCISDFARSQLMMLASPETWEKLEVVHVGIPMEQFTDDREKALARDIPSVLFIGRQVPEKGQGVLLEAVALLAERGLTVEVTIAGEGDARSEFERLAERLGLSAQVSFTGAVGQEEICDLYVAADVLCLPSFAEGVPCVLMEAMAMQTPVITTRIAGIPELVEHERTGLLVSPGRADQLADALERLLTDPALRRELGSNGREWVVREFNAESSTETLCDLFERRLGIGSSVTPERDSVLV